MKLVRDYIPQILNRQGICFDTQLAVGRAYDDALIAKLHEESDEVAHELRAGNDIKQLTEELCDLYSVIMAIAKDNGITMDDIKQASVMKFGEKGGFFAGIMVEVKTIKVTTDSSF